MGLTPQSLVSARQQHTSISGYQHDRLLQIPIPGFVDALWLKTPRRMRQMNLCFTLSDPDQILGWRPHRFRSVPVPGLFSSTCTSFPWPRW